MDETRDETNTDALQDYNNQDFSKSNPNVPGNTASTANIEVPGNASNTDPIQPEDGTDQSGVMPAHQSSSNFC
jgi:hypothetical protein